MLSFSLVLGCGGQEKVNFKEGQRFLAVDFNNDGTILAGISKTGAVILWDAIKQSKIQSLESKDRKASSLDFNKDGSLLAVGQDEDALGRHVATETCHGFLQHGAVGKKFEQLLRPRATAAGPETLAAAASEDEHIQISRHVAM
jgi:hypothetical protein